VAPCVDISRFLGEIMEQKKIERINFLAKKKKEEGLSEEELDEQKELYEEYLEGYRRNLRSTLGNTVIERPDGTRESLTKKN
jgi:uncharacterized protein YnzC (UPF0291/DUF896 family)